MTLQQTLAKKLKALREASPLTQADMCILLGISHRSNLSRIESAKQEPSISVVLAYHVIFEIPLVTDRFDVELKRVKQYIKIRIDRCTQGLVKNARDVGVHERIEFLTKIYERIKN